eukprot:3740127-Rhodomonas_salina.2
MVWVVLPFSSAVWPVWCLLRLVVRAVLGRTRCCGSVAQVPEQVAEVGSAHRAFERCPSYFTSHRISGGFL